MKKWGLADYKELIDNFVAQAENAQKENLVSIVLYGSIARGTARAESDVDLLIILKTAPADYTQRLKPFLSILQQMRDGLLWKAFRQKGMEPFLSLLILSREEAAKNQYIFLDMIEDAIFLRDDNGFFKHRLNVLQRRLRKLGSRKILMPDGSWYWDLKPDLQPGEVIAL